MVALALTWSWTGVVKYLAAICGAQMWRPASIMCSYTHEALLCRLQALMFGDCHAQGISGTISIRQGHNNTSRLPRETAGRYCVYSYWHSTSENTAGPLFRLQCLLCKRVGDSFVWVKCQQRVMPEACMCISCWSVIDDPRLSDMTCRGCFHVSTWLTHSHMTTGFIYSGCDPAFAGQVSSFFVEGCYVHFIVLGLVQVEYHIFSVILY